MKKKKSEPGFRRAWNVEEGIKDTVVGPMEKESPWVSMSEAILLDQAKQMGNDGKRFQARTESLISAINRGVG